MLVESERSPTSEGRTVSDPVRRVAWLSCRQSNGKSWALNDEFRMEVLLTEVWPTASPPQRASVPSAARSSVDLGGR